MIKSWVQTKRNTHSHIAPSTLVDRGKRSSFVPNAATRIEGASLLTEYIPTSGGSGRKVNPYRASPPRWSRPSQSGEEK